LSIAHLAFSPKPVLKLNVIEVGGIDARNREYSHISKILFQS